MKVTIVQESKDKILIEQGDADKKLPEYLKVAAELSLSISLSDDEVRDRVFHLINGTVVFGICIAELPDSFLIASPSQLISEDGRIDGKAFSSAKIIRLIRSGVAFMAIPTTEHRYYYYRWLKQQFTTLPDFFSQDRRDIISEFVYAYENRSQSKKSEQTEDQANKSTPEVEADFSKGSADSFWSPFLSKEFH